ncbi:MAG: hypothetical protein B7Z16_14995, partial [Algoriphagus sp. 32-45-6]
VLMKRRSNRTYNKQRLVKGFTVVELAAVIAVIGILATIVVVSYNNATRRAIETSMKSDLQTTAGTLETILQRENKYPATLGDVNVSEGTTLSYNQRPYGYCISAANEKTGTTFVLKSNDSQTVEEGDCDPVFETQWAGSSTGGYQDGMLNNAQFGWPSGPGGLVVGTDGNLYVSDTYNHRVRKVTPEGDVTTFIGSGASTNTVDGTGIAANTGSPASIVRNGDNSLLVMTGSRLRKVTYDGVVTTIGQYTSSNVAGVSPDGNFWLTKAGCVEERRPSGMLVQTYGVCDTYDYVDGNAATARFGQLLKGTVGKDGTVYIADRNNLRIRKISQDGTVSTYFGTGISSGNSKPIDGVTGVASMNELRNIAIDDTGAVWVSQKNNFMYIRHISPDGSRIDTFSETGPEPSHMAVDSDRGLIYIVGSNPYLFRFSI